MRIREYFEVSPDAVEFVLQNKDRESENNECVQI